MTIIVIIKKEQNLYLNKKTITENYKNLSLFFKNKLLLYMICVELFWHFGYASVEANIHIRLFK